MSSECLESKATHCCKAHVLFWVLPAIFLMENILGGPLGFAADFHGRYFLFVGALVSLILASLMRGGRAQTSVIAPLMLIVLFVVWNFVWATIIPLLNGTPLSWAISDASSLLGLSLVVAIVLATGGEFGGLLCFYKWIVKWMVVGAVVLAWFQLIVWLLGTILPEYQGGLAANIKEIYSTHGLYVGLMPDGFFRVFWISSLWLIPALYYLPLVVKNRSVSLVSFIGIAGALLATYSRGIWIGILLGGVVWLTLRLAKLVRRRFTYRQFAVWIPAFGIFVALFSFQAGPIVLERMNAITSSNDVSMVVRSEQVGDLLDSWQKAPLMGLGYGATAEKGGGRSLPFSYEMVPLALLMKLGVIGSVGFWGFFFIVAASALLVLKRHNFEAVSAFVGAFVSFLSSAVTNPLLFNFVGITILSVLLAHWVFLVGPSRVRNHLGPDRC